MSFSATTESHYLIDGHILQCRCKDDDGNWVESRLDLNQHIGNSDGPSSSLCYVLGSFPIVTLLCRVLFGDNGDGGDVDDGVLNMDDTGWFKWDMQNFSNSAQNLNLEGGHYLTADLPMAGGGYRERQGIELNDRIANDNGRLVYRESPSFYPPPPPSITILLVLFLLNAWLTSLWGYRRIESSSS